MIALLFLLACDDLVFGEKGDAPPPEGEGWCAMQEIIDASCLGCHGGPSGQGNLDLATDPHAALVDVTSAAFGVPLVTPGAPDDSLLVRKMEGTQAAGEGEVMPYGGVLDADTVALVRQWVADGADEVCTSVTTSDDDDDDSYHPVGWSAPDVHGMAAKFQTELDCRGCHGGPELQGGTGPACETCHGPNWETTCTFCHGGADPTGGAPPEGIDDSTGPQLDTFVPHTPHLTSDWADVACETCHVVPTSAFAPGHLFDDLTPGIAEVTFSNVATGGSFSSGTCTVYCHGNGQAPTGTITHTDGPRDCGSCHGAPDDILAAASMSGEHRKHMAEGLICEDCHGSTVNGGDVIIDTSLHINGTPDLLLPLVFNGTTCSGSCHGQTHNQEDW